MIGEWRVKGRGVMEYWDGGKSPFDDLVIWRFDDWKMENGKCKMEDGNW